MSTPLTQDLLDTVREAVRGSVVTITPEGLAQVSAVLRSLTNDAMHKAFWDLADAPTTPLMLLAELLEYVALGDLHEFSDIVVVGSKTSPSGPSNFIARYMDMGRDGSRVYLDSDVSAESVHHASNYWGPWQRVLRAVMDAVTRGLSDSDVARIVRGDPAHSPGADFAPLRASLYTWGAVFHFFIEMVKKVVFQSYLSPFRTTVNDAFLPTVLRMFAEALPTDVGTGGLAVLQGLQLTHSLGINNSQAAAACEELLAAPENGAVHARSIFLASKLLRNRTSYGPVLPLTFPDVLASRCASFLSTRLEFQYSRTLCDAHGTRGPWFQLLGTNVFQRPTSSDIVFFFGELCEAAHTNDAVAAEIAATDLASIVWRLLAREEADAFHHLWVARLVDVLFCSAPLLTDFAPDFEVLVDKVGTSLRRTRASPETLARFTTVCAQVSDLRRWSAIRSAWVAAVARVGADFNQRLRGFVANDDGDGRPRFRLRRK